MVMTSENLMSFCRDVDALTQHPRYAKRFTFVPPEVGSGVILICAGNPILVKIIEVEDNTVIGEITDVVLTTAIPPGKKVRGTYQGKTSEWHYKGDEGMIGLEDYRQILIDSIKGTKWIYRIANLRQTFRCHNASVNRFLLTVTGQALLTQTCTLLDTLTWSKKKGEMLYFGLLGLNVAFLLIMVMMKAGLPEMLINGACTLYALYNWYRDVRTQRRMQKRFDTYWPECQQEYQKLRDMVTRYGLSPNRIHALRKWVLMTMSRLDYNLMSDLGALHKVWSLTLLNHIDTLNMEDSATEQQTKLDTLLSLMDTYNHDITRFQTIPNKT